MTSRLPARVASKSLILTLAFTAAFLALPGDTAAGRTKATALEPYVTEITQCDAENAVARETGGAVKRRDPGCVVEAGDRAQWPQPRPLEDMKGKLRPPVSGTIVRYFGEKDGEGHPSDGIVLQTRPGAQVVAPYYSTIIFAQAPGEFSPSLILSAADGYHFILAGMTKIYGAEGQKLLEGEPVGVMSGTGDAPDANAGPELYFEFRKNRKPIDPLPWLATARLERTLQ